MDKNDLKRLSDFLRSEIHDHLTVVALMVLVSIPLGALLIRFAPELGRWLYPKGPRAKPAQAKTP